MNWHLFIKIYLLICVVTGSAYFFTFSPPAPVSGVPSPKEISGTTAINAIALLRKDQAIGPIYTGSTILSFETRKNWLIHYDTTLGRISYDCTKENSDSLVKCTLRSE